MSQQNFIHKQLQLMYFTIMNFAELINYYFIVALQNIV